MAEAQQLGRLPSGYDEEFASEVEDDCQCLICHLPLKEPVLTRCGHRFCKECLDEHFRRQEDQAQPNTCPADRQSLDRDRDVFPDKATERKILSFAIKCPSEGCVWIGELRNKQVHLETCSSNVVSCTNENCHVTLKRKYLENHVTITCEWRIIECEYCKEPHSGCHMKDHFEKCKKFPLTCPNSCGDSIPREMLPIHIEHDCPLTLVSCPYVQMGCNKKVERKKVKCHLESSMREHLDYACVKLSSTMKTTRNLEGKVEALQKQLEKKGYKERESENTRFVWKINKFSEILSQAKASKKTKIESDPFYTERYGYKLKVLVFPKSFWLPDFGNHLAVSIVVMRGEYDAILPWPYHNKVTFTLIDQQEDPLQREDVVFSEKQIFSRPKEAENAGDRHPLSISHKELQTGQYLVDDTLFLQVEIGPP